LYFRVGLSWIILGHGFFLLTTVPHTLVGDISLLPREQKIANIAFSVEYAGIYLELLVKWPGTWGKVLIWRVLFFLDCKQRQISIPSCILGNQICPSWTAVYIQCRIRWCLYGSILWRTRQYPV